jgi:hypothetical protein
LIKTPSLEEPFLVSKGITKYQKFHQSHEAYQRKKGGNKPNKIPSLKELSLAITAHLEKEAAYALCKASNTLCL